MWKEANPRPDSLQEAVQLDDDGLPFALRIYSLVCTSYSACHATNIQRCTKVGSSKPACYYTAQPCLLFPRCAGGCGSAVYFAERVSSVAFSACPLLTSDFYRPSGLAARYTRLHLVLSLLNAHGCSTTASGLSPTLFEVHELWQGVG